MRMINRFGPWVLGVYIAIIFIDSLRFKFAGHPTPKHIFTTLREWSGIDLFYPAGPWVIGLGELGASGLLLGLPILLILLGQKRLAGLSQMAGAAISILIMSGAIGFHLFTPLGIETPTAWNADGTEILAQGPLLFYMACGVWVSGIVILLMRRAHPDAA